jgi:hypothetical protein
LKLSREPSFSFPIWWHIEQETPSSAAAFLGITVEWKMREYLTQVALQLCLVAGDGHVAVRATIFELVI